MAWIRLSDDYTDHPKFDRLSDGAFRLWHQGIAFCRKYQTDGMIPLASLRGFKAYSPKRQRELTTPWQAGARALWEALDGFGMRVHDYLQWNPSKDEENERRTGSRERMRVSRERRYAPGVPPPSEPAVALQQDCNIRATNMIVTPTESRATHALVPGGERDLDLDREKGSGEKPDQDRVEARAQRLREELYPQWYAKYRHGARLRIPLIVNSMEFQEAMSLVQTWDDARLEKLARIVLTTNDEFIAGTDRGFKIFALKASWADSRLSEIESKSA
jgi:hypothetical protein